mgnify:CR=1 FL=1
MQAINVFPFQAEWKLQPGEGRTKRDFLSLHDLTVKELTRLLDLAEMLKQQPARFRRALEGRNIALIFEKPSLRTRVTFEAGAHQLGADAIYLSQADIALGKREPAADVARNLARQMRRVLAYETHLQTGELRSRIARYLLFLADTPASFRDEGGLYVTVSHEEIADATASTRESVSKLLSDMRREGLIATAYRKVYLLDLEGLEAEAQSALEAA